MEITDDLIDLVMDPALDVRVCHHLHQEPPHGARARLGAGDEDVLQELLQLPFLRSEKRR